MSGYTQIVTKEGDVPKEGYIVVGDDTDIKCTFENIVPNTESASEKSYSAVATFTTVEGKTPPSKVEALGSRKVILIQHTHPKNIWTTQNSWVMNDTLGQGLLLLEKQNLKNQNGGRRRKTLRRKHRKNRKHSHRKN